MNTKRKIIISIVILIAVIGFGALLYYLVFPALVLGHLDSPQVAWKYHKADALRDIPLVLNQGDYNFATYLYRQAKCHAEYCSVKRLEFEDFISLLKNNIPPTINLESLPFDLREENIGRIRFGLCSKGKNRLEDEARKEELDVFASEVCSAIQADATRTVEAYSIYIEEGLLLNGFLNDEDKIYLEEKTKLKFRDFNQPKDLKDMGN